MIPKKEKQIHRREIEEAIDYERDFSYNYFGFHLLSVCDSLQLAVVTTARWQAQRRSKPTTLPVVTQAGSIQSHISTQKNCSDAFFAVNDAFLSMDSLPQRLHTDQEVVALLHQYCIPPDFT